MEHVYACVHLHVQLCHMYLCAYFIHWSSLCRVYILAHASSIAVCVYACVSQNSLDGKFPRGPLHSHLNALFLFSIPLCHPPVRLLSCLTLVFVSSRERIENTTCHKLFRGPSPFSPWQRVYNSLALRLYLFLKPPLIQSRRLVLCLSPSPCKARNVWLWQAREYLT